MTGVLKVDNIQNSSGTSAMTIDSNGKTTLTGHLKITNAVAFHAYFNSGGTNGIPATNSVVFPLEHFDEGNNYNTSTGKFTAPVNGIYHFHAQILSNYQARLYINFMVNDAEVYGTRSETAIPGNAHQEAHAIMTHKLNAGDTVHLKTHQAAYANVYCGFSGHLVAEI